MLIEGSQSPAGRGALEQVRMLPELPSFVSPTANVLLFTPASRFRGKIPTPLQQVGSGVMAASLQWQHARMAAAPTRGGGFPQDRGQVCAGTGSQGWDLQRRGRGLQSRGPFLPLLLPARGRILHCNFKCYNFLITSSKTMSSLCGKGPPPSRLVLHAPLAGSRAFMGKDSSIVWDGQLRGPHPLNPHRLPRGTAGRDPHP